ncbi:MAG: ribosome assembly cofactor RimP [Flavobacteriales bacterium]|nr:ribosome assembly cofactor RimP [Flavobacteriales bacterium]
MITIERIQELIDEGITSDQFIVELRIDTGNRIYVELDDLKRPTSISDCVALSRQIEHNLDRETEDFSIEVTSPGLDKPFKVYQQYVKNVGRPVKVRKVTDEVIKGILKEVADDSVKLETKEKKKIEGRKAKAWFTEMISIPMDEIKETYVELVF